MQISPDEQKFSADQADLHFSDKGGRFCLTFITGYRHIGQQSGRTCIGFFYTEHSRKHHMCDLDK